ncbi:M48 family metallopeptidase [Erwinia sp. P6884]|uniref:M48 metallopeptidase family protein n=1 Tax=Erwinia sp. P6884 TaxID=3141450 RepID=UPI00319B08EA
MTQLRYLNGYPSNIITQVQTLFDQSKLGLWLDKKYPGGHSVQNDKALYQYVSDLKQRYVRNASALSKVMYDNKQNPIKGTLGTNTFVSRVQGGKLKSNNEIRIATLFRDGPEDFLRMIVVHELAHLKEKEHNKAFYQLCCHMDPDYHQLEFDMRLWLNWKELNKERP